MTADNVLARLKSFIGCETEYVADQPVDAGMIRRFARAIGDENPLYRNEIYARRHGFDGIIAPPTFVFEWDHHEALYSDAKGVYISDYLLPPRFVRVGNEYEFALPLRPGDIITTRSKIADVSEKRRSSGERMVVIVTESSYTNQHGALLGKQRSTGIVFI